MKYDPVLHDLDQEEAKLERWEAMAPDREELSGIIQTWFYEKYDEAMSLKGLRKTEDFVDEFLELEL